MSAHGIDGLTINIYYRYDKELIIRDFFSFKEEHTTELNPGVNILVGINGSGKTLFLNAFTLLYEGIAGGGLSALFRQGGGTYNAIVNAYVEERPECFSVTYVFNADELKNCLFYCFFYSYFCSDNYHLREDKRLNNDIIINIMIVK